MQRKSQSVRIVSDVGGVVVVNPDLDGNGEPVTLHVQEDVDMTPMTLTLDAEAADALVDAIDEARGRRKRQRPRAGAGDDEQQGGGPAS